ncbi:unannotated protein [freshwater metagenome]|uniref:Unannotated protein n=1 Tax=freshwater metagenome TaxID=449393 RepID=A0A6J7HIJ5_9ZZZZ
MTDRLANLRDVGGLPVRGGGTIRAGVLLRSDAPYGGDAAPGLAVWPPRTVVDLRAPDEAPGRHPLEEAHGATIIALPLHNAAGISAMRDLPEGDRAFHRIYGAMLGSGALLGRIATIVADEPGPVLLHCAAGKDRTGVSVAVLLSAVGVERAAILEDYTATAANMPGVIARIRVAFGAHPEFDIDTILRERPDLLAASPTGLAAALDAADEQYGGTAGLLLDTGLDAAVLERLRARLVAA